MEKQDGVFYEEERDHARLIGRLFGKSRQERSLQQGQGCKAFGEGLQKQDDNRGEYQQNRLQQVSETLEQRRNGHLTNIFFLKK